MLHFLTLGLGFLALGGCQTVDSVIGGPESHYSCVTGGLITARPGVNRRHLDVTYALDGQVYFKGVLQSVPSDFGERFTADTGTTFWINGDKGLFSRPGEDQILCHQER